MQRCRAANITRSNSKNKREKVSSWERQLNMRAKVRSNDIRIITCNINTFPSIPSVENSIKRDKLQAMITESKAEIILMSEHNLNMKGIQGDYRPDSVMEGWQDSMINRFNNIMDEGTSTHT